VTGEGLVRLSEVSLQGVGKRCGDTWAVRDVSIYVRPGEFYALLGPPGSGKSTILRMLAGFVRPDAGRIEVDDQWIDPVPPQRRDMGMVFQSGALWPHMSVFENVAFGLRERRVSGTRLARKVEEALARVGAQGLGQRRPAELSTGERQRVALARALAIEPRLLLLDEPLADLDAREGARTRLELGALQRDLGITTLCATRDHAEALSLAGRIAVLRQGRVVQEGRPEEVYWKPRDRFVAEFVGAANLVPVRVTELRELGVVVEMAGGIRFPVAAGGHPWQVGARGVLCLRPEALALEEAALAPGGIPGTLRAAAFEGGRRLYEVATPAGPLRVEAISSAAAGQALRIGDPVKVEVSAETSVLLPDDDRETAP
jgi:ABC-type Fe3+/spermidine/putrescine transport system ATPase subunit